MQPVEWPDPSGASQAHEEVLDVGRDRPVPRWLERLRPPRLSRLALVPAMLIGVLTFGPSASAAHRQYPPPVVNPAVMWTCVHALPARAVPSYQPGLLAEYVHVATNSHHCHGVTITSR
ncbi:MAG: hypothetical protein JWO57_2391 [Pseudonocardiales bacterium]|nr:hypothetical protein [Pseudonocardiales bacterium]